jgi:hypothetical protein
MLSAELQMGKAGEHLVVADLLLAGYNAFLSDQGLPYDVLVDVNGRFVRVSVKSTHRPYQAKPPKHCPTYQPTPSYRFHLRCGRYRKQGEIKLISVEDIDVIALVALDVRLVAYFPCRPPVPSIIEMRTPDGTRGRNFKEHAGFGEAAGVDAAAMVYTRHSEQNVGVFA